MNLIYILFSPKGRIGPKDFWRGIIILIGFQIVSGVLTLYGPVFIALLLSFISFFIIYPYYCVFGKRLHDAGKSSWMFLLFMIGYIVILMVIILISPGFMDALSQYMEYSEAGDLEAAQVMMERINSDYALNQFGATIIANFALGFLAARLSSHPGPNQYGPPTGQ